MDPGSERQHGAKSALTVGLGIWQGRRSPVIRLLHLHQAGLRRKWTLERTQMTPAMGETAFGTRVHSEAFDAATLPPVSGASFQNQSMIF